MAATAKQGNGGNHLLGALGRAAKARAQLRPEGRDRRTAKAQGLSYADLNSALSAALLAKFPPPPLPGGSLSAAPWPVDTFDDYVVFERDGKLWRVDYRAAVGGVELVGEPQQVVRTYAPAAPAAAKRLAEALSKARAVRKDSAVGAGGGASGVGFGDVGTGDLAAGGGLKQPQQGKEPRRRFRGIPVIVDRPKGYVQEGKDAEGKAWKREYKFDYGYVPGTAGGDGEGLDVFLGPDEGAPLAHWVLQQKADGSFDEYKLMLGFGDRRAAKAAYTEHVPKRYFRSMATTSVEMVKALLGIEPNEVAKSLLVHALKDAMAVPGHEGATFAEHARAWVETRGLLEPDADYGGDLGRAVLRMADTFGGEGHSGMSARLARAYFGFLCDAWEGTHTMILNDDDFAKAIAALEKIAKDAADVFVSTVGEGQLGGLAGGGGDDMQTCIVGHMRNGKTEEEARALCMGVAGAKRAPFGKGWFGKARDLGTAQSPRIEKHVRLVVQKADESAAADQRYVLGIVLEPEVVDGQGDIYSADEVRKSAWRYMADFRNIGLMHKGLVNGRVVLVESYVAPVDMNVQGSDIKAGTWLLGLYIPDDELWEQVKSGGLTGLSIGGFAKKTPVGERQA